MKPTSIPRVSLTRPVLTRFSTLLHVPPSPAESRKFLSLVKDSFRSSLAASTPNEEPTDTHINRILTTEPFTAKLTTIEDRLKIFNQDPLSLFDQQCLTGKLDIDLAAICLSKYLRLKREEKSQTEAVPEELQWSAVSIVLGRLKQVGLAPKDAFMNKKLAKAVAGGLVMEGEEKKIVMWSKMTDQEFFPLARQNIVYFGVQDVLIHHGWERAAELFRQVIAGTRPGARFSKRVYSSAGLMLCQAGMERGLQELPEYGKLVRKSSIWGLHWQMQAWVSLNYGKRVSAGVKYFKSFIGNPDDTRTKVLGSFWYRQDSEFPLKLVQECLAQGMLEEAEMVKEVVEKQFADKVRKWDIFMMRRSIERAKDEARVAREATGEDPQGIQLMRDYI